MTKLLSRLPLSGRVGLGFAAGAMLYVVAAELLPTRGDPGPGALAFAAGFTVMMILDVALG